MASMWELWNAAMLVAAAAVALVWLTRRRQQSLFKRLGYPGPKPNLVWGSWKELQKDRIKVMQKWIDKYGKVFGFYLATEPYMVITDTEVIRECFVKESHTFQDRSMYSLDVEPFTSCLLFIKGETWRTVRSVLNQCFTTSKVKLLFDTVSKCSDVFLNELHEECRKGNVAEVYHRAQSLSLDIITKTALAWEVNCQRQSDDPVLTGMRRLFGDIDKVAFESAFAFPGLRTILRYLYPLTAFSRCMKKMMNDVDTTARLRRAGQKPPSSDILQTILDAQAGDKARTCGGKVIDDRYVISNCIILLLAGFDTTSAALAFTMYLVAKHPEEQARILGEAEARFPGTAELSFDQLHQLERLDAVVKESLRLYPSVPIMVMRRCAQDTTVLGHFIPEGMTIVAPPWHIHRDPQLWPEPEEFRPDRFLGEWSSQRPVSAYLPFGLGQRTCLGKRVALLSLKTTFMRVLQAYKLDICEQTQDPIRVVVPNLVLNPENGVHLRFTPRDA